MKTQFKLEALPRRMVESLFSFTDEELARHHARWTIVDAKPGYPCRVSLADADVGERVLLLNYAHHDVESPYRTSGPIFVREAAETARLEANEIPAMFRCRQLSIRAYDERAMMLAACTAAGEDLEDAIGKCFDDPQVDYLHIHNAGPGCFNCSVRRA